MTEIIRGYHVGDTIVCGIIFPNDPAIVSFEGYSPTKSQTLFFGPNPEITRTDVGKYSCNVTFDVAGLWYFEWLGRSADQSRSKAFFLEVKCKKC